jgi:hypothetical protein
VQPPTGGVRFKGEKGGKDADDFTVGLFLGKAFSIAD